MNMFHMTIPDHPDATMNGYILDCDLTLGQYVLRPAIVVCPGGGYVYCSRAEGEPVPWRMRQEASIRLCCGTPRGMMLQGFLR